MNSWRGYPRGLADGTCHQAASNCHDPRQLRGEDSCAQAPTKTQPAIGHESEGSAYDADLDPDWVGWRLTVRQIQNTEGVSIGHTGGWCKAIGEDTE